MAHPPHPPHPALVTALRFPLPLAFLLLQLGTPPQPVQAHPGSGIAVDPSGRVFFAAGPIIVRIDPNGQASTIVHDQSNAKFYQLHHIQRAPDGSLITASDFGTSLWRFSPEGELSAFYPPPNDMRALAVGAGGDPFAIDRHGNIYAVNSAQHRFTQILQLDPQGRIKVLAGGDWGFADGPGPAARFADLHGASFLATPDGALLLTDHYRLIRRVASDGTVSTLAGGDATGHVDGPGRDARFDGASGLALSAGGDLLVAEQSGYIRRITPAGVVTTFAGTGRRGGHDGPLLEATFEEPTGIAAGPNDDLFVLEPGIPRVRRLRDGRVTTLHQGLPSAATP